MATFVEDVRKSATRSIVLSVLMMIAGVLAICIPPLAGVAVTLMFGWLLIIAGLLHLGFAWRGDGAWTVIGEILLAALYAVVGFYTLAHPLAGLASLTFVFATYLVFKGVVEGVVAFKLWPVPGSGWLVFDAVVTIAIAALIAGAWPASAAWAIGVLVGVNLFTSGLARLMMSAAVRRLVA